MGSQVIDCRLRGITYDITPMKVDSDQESYGERIEKSDDGLRVQIYWLN